ncbi:sensor histidine kinase [Yinghuangia soli]|uniref:histidine kinase n=1 Tax=Yinghuangia soli TaxID=2908204 RepID=A0AA41Q150_9ACTN|nr:sensor histidine kinase [Yinghuangia soli]MCF2529630.1 sensor histidine kinase [Yinghuangia soli]
MAALRQQLTRCGPQFGGAVLGLLAVVETLNRMGSGMALDDPESRPFLLILALLTTVPIALLPAYPTAVGVLVTAAAVLSLLPFRVLTVPGLAAQLIVLYHLGRHSSRLFALAPLPVFGAYALAASGDIDQAERTYAVMVALLAFGAVAAGLSRRVRTEAQVHSAAAQAVADTMYEHAARGERARIARELHDVVAHHISMIAVQAETARFTTAGMPPEGAKRLLAIGDTARAALTEMRRLLGVLREDAGTTGGRKPQPALQQLVDLVDEAREASGTATRLIVRGDIVPLDPGIELTAYRIVQEALTNARRHAPGAAVDVELHYTGGALALRIRDNGPGPRRTAATGTAAAATGTAGEVAAGHGLVGMRERAAMVGGELHVGEAVGGGFIIDVRLPVPDAETA